MGLTKKDKQNPLFLGINKDIRGNGHFITFPLTLENKARDMISQLPSFLVHKYDKDILKYFTPSAMERALAGPWDKEMHCAKSPEI